MLRQVDVDAAVRLARGCADEPVFHAVDLHEPLTPVERRALLTIAATIDREAMRWAGLEPRSPEAQAIIDRAPAAVLP